MMNLFNKRLGNWCWTLSADERMTAALSGSAQSEKTELSKERKRKYAAMLAKQKKLLARGASGLR